MDQRVKILLNKIRWVIGTFRQFHGVLDTEEASKVSGVKDTEDARDIYDNILSLINIKFNCYFWLLMNLMIWLLKPYTNQFHRVFCIYLYCLYYQKDTWATLPYRNSFWYPWQVFYKDTWWPVSSPWSHGPPPPPTSWPGSALLFLWLSQTRTALRSLTEVQEFLYSNYTVETWVLQNSHRIKSKRLYSSYMYRF